MKLLRKRLLYAALLFAITITCLAAARIAKEAENHRLTAGGGYIKWVDFHVTETAMNDALKIDLETYGTSCHINWIDALSYLGAKYGGSFKGYKKSDLTAFSEKLQSGQSLDALTANMKYFSYYREAYGAILEEYVGEFYRDGQFCYGLRAFSPKIGRAHV